MDSEQAEEVLRKAGGCILEAHKTALTAEVIRFIPIIFGAGFLMGLLAGFFIGLVLMMI